MTDSRPYVMSTEITLRPGQVGVRPDDHSLIYSMTDPFVVQQVALRFTALDENGAVLDPQPTVLDRFIKLTLTDAGTNARIAHDLPFRRTPGGEAVWAPNEALVRLGELADVVDRDVILARGIVVRQAGGFEASFESRESFAVAGTTLVIKAIQVRLSFEGQILRYP